MVARSLIGAAFVCVSWGGASAGAAVCNARSGVCHGEDATDSSLLQRPRSFVSALQRDVCEVGANVQCPESGNWCMGDQCCPRHSTTVKTFPCPSASSEFAGCESNEKITDCTAAAPTTPAPYVSTSFGSRDTVPTSTRLGSRDTVPNSVYFLTVDRFARSNGNDTECDNDNTWCGGDLRGLINHLDYIQEMGFEAVWITPVLKQFDGETPSGTGCMGYWAYDLYEIDEHFGTKQDMKDLVQELHKRDMVIIYDFVANHMGPIHNKEMVAQMRPFNETKYFNQLFIGNMTFDEYTNQSSNWPPPAQAMWSQSGAQCTQGRDCSCYKCVQNDDLGTVGGSNPWGACDGEMVFNDESPCPKGAYSKYCMPGDYGCEGYNVTITQGGWFYDLGDLNQTDPFVRKAQLDWIKWFVTEYDIDYLRLDTAAFMTFDFLSELQESANVSIMGEVTTTNLTYHANFQSNPPGPDGREVLDGVLNFPLYYSAIAGFCGEWWPFSQWNLTFLGERMEAQLEAPYRSLERLGNFIDNHDVTRLFKVCNQDSSRITNALTWVMMAKGTPIIYYGTESNLSEVRTSLWQTGYDTKSEGFLFFKTMNAIRAQIPATADLKVLSTEDSGTLVFSRGSKVFVFLNNFAASSSDGSTYCGVDLPDPEEGMKWVDALGGSELSTGSTGCVEFATTGPVVLVQKTVLVTLQK
mmetsp:Transcript_175895/g.563951  ORF Transcript_175895/g.563951 Transcript_175895/m.563951 type:complete len:693 (-) Transcript_175895:131-2209(-)